MSKSKMNGVIRVVIALIFCGVVAASFTRVSLMEPRKAIATKDRVQSDNASLVADGRRLFDGNRAVCHFAVKAEAKYGPGLKGLSKTRKLPMSGREASEANIRAQLNSPVKSMPRFDKLTDQEIRSIAAYLLTL